MHCGAHNSAQTALTLSAISFVYTFKRIGRRFSKIIDFQRMATQTTNIETSDIINDIIECIIHKYLGHLSTYNHEMFTNFYILYFQK